VTKISLFCPDWPSGCPDCIWVTLKFSIQSVWIGIWFLTIFGVLCQIVQNGSYYTVKGNVSLKGAVFICIKCYQSYISPNLLQLTTFLQFRLASSILPQSPYFFICIFRLDVVLINMNFARFLIAWRN